MAKKGFLALFIVATAIVFLLWVAKVGKHKIIPEVEKYRQAELELTKVNMASLERVIVAFIAEEGRTPGDLRELRALHGLLSTNLDAWGTAIKYERLSDESFRLISAGKDKAFNTADDVVVNH